MVLRYPQELLQCGLDAPTIGALKIGEFANGDQRILRSKNWIIISPHVHRWGKKIHGDWVALSQFAEQGLLEFGALLLLEMGFNTGGDLL
jgi:hypothetical protein